MSIFLLNLNQTSKLGKHKLCTLKAHKSKMSNFQIILSISRALNIVLANRDDENIAVIRKECNRTMSID